MVSLDRLDGPRRPFCAIKRKDEGRHGQYRTNWMIVQIYDAMAEAIRTGRPYQTLLDPPPGPPAASLPDWQPGQPRPANWPSHIHPPRAAGGSRESGVGRPQITARALSLPPLLPIHQILHPCPIRPPPGR